MNADRSRPDSIDRELLAGLLPAPSQRDLPERRHHALREYLMNEIQEQTRPSASPTGPAGRRMPIRKRLLAGAMAVAGVLTAAAALLLAESAASSPAWAVESGPGNTVTIRINEYRDADGLEARLREEGIRAVVDYVPNGKRCTNAIRRNDDPGVDWLANRDGGVVMTIDRDDITADQTLGILISIDDDKTHIAFNIVLVRRTIEHCIQQ